MLLERITLDAIGRPVLSNGEVQQAELEQVGNPQLPSVFILATKLVFACTGRNSV